MTLQRTKSDVSFHGMGGVAMRWVLSAVIGLSIGASAFAMGSASAQPIPAPSPGPAQPGSTTEELADMVMDVIEDGAPATTPVPAPIP